MNPIQQLLTENIGLWTGADTAKKSGRGRASGSAGTVYGIKKLRELILELAVRGKLVPQDPSDEPASALLERIRKEKATMVLEGKIKKDKPLATIAADETPFPLPDSWAWVRLGDISSAVQYGYTESANHQLKDVLFLRITDIQDDSVDWATVPGCSISLLDSDSYALENFDLVIARTGGTIGKSYLVSGLNSKAVFASYLIRIGKLSSTSSEYKKVFLGSILYWKQLLASSMGTGQPNVNGTALKNLKFSLPPLAEQRRIVAKVNELMALCDQLEAGYTDATDAHEKLVSHLLAALTASQDSADFSASWQRIAAHFDMLFTTEASIDALKQTLLQLAVMGKLVPQDLADGPASTLLECIQAEKARLVFEGEIKKGKPLAAISDDEKPFTLPLGWEWIRLNNLLKKLGAGSTPLGGKQVYVDDGIPFLRSQNVWNEGLRLDDVVFILPETHGKMSGTHVCAGDLLFNITGASIGRCAIVPESFETGNVSQHVTIVRPISNEILQFLHLVLMSRHVQKTVMDVQVGVSREGLSIGKFGQFIIPFPPLDEQRRIVAKVNELMALCDRMKTRIVDVSALQRKLADVMVAQAVA